MGCKELGPYRLLAGLGAGAAGTVYKAESPDGSTCAVKIIHPHLLRTADFTRRLEREVAIGREVRHENVVRTFDAGSVEIDGVPTYGIVMEYVEGQTLRRLREEVGSVPESFCRLIAVQAARGLEAIHAARVIHRDLKPENILIGRDHRIKIMDLGVACLVDETLRHPALGAFSGSVLYAAPEQWNPEARVDGRADLYALGVILHELASGLRPGKARRNSAYRFTGLGEIVPNVTPFFEQLVNALVATNPRERFASARELHAVLDEGEASDWWRTRASKIGPAGRPALSRVRVPRQTALHGREKELAALRTWYDEAARGEGRVVLVQGEAGVGKTRLIDEFVQRLLADGADAQFLYGGYSAGGAATSSGAFSAAYREFLGADRLEEQLAAHLADAAPLIPAFTALLRGEPTPRNRVPLTMESMQTLFRTLNRSLASDRPTIVFLDDLHCAPSEGLAVFASLTNGLVGTRLLVIGTARRGRIESWIADLCRHEGVRRMLLQRLDSSAIEALLHDVLGSGALAGQLTPRLADMTDGNPHFIFEVLDELRDRGILRALTNGSCTLTACLDGIVVPATVRELILARVANLRADERDLIEMASCCGVTFDPTLVAEAAALPVLPTLKACGRIEAEHRLIRADGARYRFDHHQAQETIHAGLPRQKRAQYHAHLGRALEVRAEQKLTDAVAFELCDHFLHGGCDEAARRHLPGALRHLEKGHLHESRLKLAERALACPDLLVGDDRLRVLRHKIDSLNMMLRTVEERAALEQALEVVETIDDPGCATGVYNALGNHHFLASRFAEARRWLERGRAAAVQVGNIEEQIRAERGLGNICCRESRVEEAREHFKRCCSLARRGGNAGLEAGSTVDLGMTYATRGDLAKAREHYELGLRLARGARHGPAEALASSRLGPVLMQHGNYEEALRMARRFRQICHEIGDVRGELRAAATIATVLGQCGALDEMAAELASAQRLAEDAVDPLSTAAIIQAQAWIAEQRGDLAEAERLYRAALDYRTGTGDDDGIALSLIAFGRIHTARGEADAAESCLSRAAQAAARANSKDARTLAECYRSLMDARRIPHARALVEDHGEVLGDAVAREAHFVLWKATRSPSQLESAYRSLMRLAAHIPQRYRESTLENVALHRSIVAAWAGEAAIQH